MKRLLPILLLLIFGIVATVDSYLVRNAVNFISPHLARIFIWHFPCPIAFTVMMLVGTYFCVQSLRSGEAHWDRRASAVLELGAVFGVLVLATGIIFSWVQWDSPWSWDPRQTSFLMVMLIYMAYFVLRAAIPDPRARAANSAVYFLVSVLPQLFLVFVFPRLPQGAGNHPADTISGAKLSPDYAIAVCLTLVLMFLLSALLYRQRVRSETLTLSLEDLT
jgi:heme exporter protein C